MAGKYRSSTFLQETANLRTLMSPFLLLLLLAVTNSNATLASTQPPVQSPFPAPTQPPLPGPVPPPSPSPQLHHNQQQLNNIIDALIGSGDFNSWADILSAADSSGLPISATLFIPSDESLPNDITIEPLMFLYHIIPQRLSFSELRLLKPLSRLLTLLPSKTILITNNSLSNFTLDDRLLSRPDLYTSHSVSVHGIASLLDYSVYGDGLPTTLPTPTPTPPSPPRSPSGIMTPPGIDQLESDALCVRTESWTVFFVVLCPLLALKT